MEEFERLHRAQLQAIGFPETLLPRLFSKLTRRDADNLEDVFQLAPSRESVTGNVLKCRVLLRAEADVYVLRHIWSSEGRERGRDALLSDLPLLEEVANGLGVALPWERRQAAMEQMMTRAIQQTGKSKVVARKALVETGYDLVGAILKAGDISEDDIIAQRTGGNTPSLTMEEFKKGLEGLCGGGEEVPQAQLEAMYEDWKDRKLREPVRDSEDWVHCGRYKWREEEEGVVCVYISVPPDTKKKDIKSVITSRRWAFAVKNVTVIEGEFFGRVVPEECYWTMGDGCVSVSVQRVEGEEWGELIVGETQGESMGREDMTLCADEVLQKTKKLNLFYSAVTSEGRFPLPL